MILLIFQRI